ncbi:hypothetical protein D8674_024425 [Pyrus ussuriensis x Pyrus communis]|uniref:DUF7953 domain-containing protein n=1 Tax=Pyrus ussuriensis x Pyrus communis TaxID=2448454 RepID=A0A5N5H6M7_9ROSA|nr:hypothetical protein D8674_024425 [Pyrus ussuriensis x Pyrus communis]
MSIRELRSSTVSVNLFTFCVFLSCFPGFILSAIVTLDSIVIYNTHELIKAVKPKVYFQCIGGNKTNFPDVKEKNVRYNFNGEESWQPLTEFSGKKCKRCGLYEADTFKPDDKFDEWELCPSDFNASDGKYVRFKNKEFNITFWCPKCVPDMPASSSTTAPDKEEKEKGMHVVLILLIVVAVLAVCIVIGFAAYKYWQKKKREQDQARFLKLFEDGDDIEDEMGLDHII